jgi:type II secretory pathway pseudopilin PulG
MGILAAATILTLAHSASRARGEAVRRDLEGADALVRAAARQSGQVQHLVFDLIHEQVIWQTNDDEASDVTLLQLPDSDSITVRAEDGASDYGRVQIDVSPCDYSPSYAVKFQQGDSESPWMVVAGMTGQIVWMDDDNRKEDIFKTLDAGEVEASQAADFSAGDSNGPDAH